VISKPAFRRFRKTVLVGVVVDHHRGTGRIVAVHANANKRFIV
jgi:hypothetical protein